MQITTKNCDIPTPYTQNCFGVEVGIKRHGTFADFVLAASKPVTWDLKASKQPPLNGQLLGTDTTMSSAALQSTWVNPLLGLEAATDYFCVITATDAMNNAEAPWSTSVNIKTLNGKALTEDLFFEVYVTVSVSYK